MPNQEKLPRAWVYARIPGDCAATRASYDACCRQAGDDGCTVVGGSIDYKGYGPLRDGYQSMLAVSETARSTACMSTACGRSAARSGICTPFSSAQ